MNEDVKVMAKSAMVLSDLPVSEQAARTWEAVQVTGSILSAAPDPAIEAFQAELKQRWAPEIAAMEAKLWQEGPSALAGMPWLYLRKSDGKPPAIASLLEAALTNKNRNPRDVLLSLQNVPPASREAVSDQVRAFLGEAFGKATGLARDQYITLMRSKPSFNWPKDPWAAVLPIPGGSVVYNVDAPVELLLENVGETNDGGIYDSDPTDDPFWVDLIRNWDGEILNTNPAAIFFKSTVGAVEGLGGGLSRLAAVLQYLPVVLVSAVGVGAVVVGVSYVTKLRRLPEHV